MLTPRTIGGLSGTCADSDAPTGGREPTFLEMSFRSGAIAFKAAPATLRAPVFREPS